MSNERLMSNVSRSVYQKLSEEHKKLLRDMYVITMKPLTLESILTRQKWCKKFKEEIEFNAMLREVAIQYIKDHPEYDIMKRIEEKKNGHSALKGF